MKRSATQENGARTVNHAGTFCPALDSRKRKVRGLCVRNGRFYAQMRVDRGDGTTRPIRISLEAETLDQAKVEMERRRTERQMGTVHVPGHRPKFSALVEAYKLSAEFLSKKLGTRENETQALNRWSSSLGGVRIDRIATSHMTAFRNARKAQGVTSRTINLDLVAFNNAMAYAAQEKLLTTVPRLKKLKEVKAPERQLLTRQNISALLESCVPEVTKNAGLLRLYLRFLLLTGAREQEALKVRKADVDLDGRRLTIGADGDTKNRESRIVEMGDDLFGLLDELLRGLPSDTSYLFPSPQRGQKDIPCRSLRESFKLVRSKAGLTTIGFHDFRHHFCSTCVMAGIDFMTIASWVGHKDGGLLVGRTYGHLNDAHKRRMAAKLPTL